MCALLWNLNTEAYLCCLCVSANVEVFCQVERVYSATSPLNSFQYIQKFLFLLIRPTLNVEKTESPSSLSELLAIANCAVIYSSDALTCVAFGDLYVLADLQLESFLHHNFLTLSLNRQRNLPSPSHSSV